MADMKTLLYENTELFFILLRVTIQPIVAYLLNFVVLADKVTPPMRRLVAQRIARAFSGVTITVMAVILLLDYPVLFEDKWFAECERGVRFMRAFLLYLIVDTIEIVYAHFVHGCPSQVDLIVHHVAGFWFFSKISATGIGLWYGITCLPSELLTLFSGSVFFFSSLDTKKQPWANTILQIASKLRFWTIPLFRGPLWLYMQYYVYLEYFYPTFPSRHGDQLSFMIQFGLCTAYALDTYWMGMLMGVFKSKGEIKKNDQTKKQSKQN